MAYEKILLPLTIFTFLCMLQVSEGGLNGKLVSMLKKKSDICTKTEGVSMSQKEQMDMVAQKCPQSESGKKALLCVTKSAGMINPETCQVNIEGVKEMSKKFGRNKPEKEKMIKAGNTCQAQVAKKIKSCEPVTEASDVICKCLMAQKMF
ncbi:uncharacterized protein LOC134535639 [Bacillus rossius redtenbacheri]|uniref:uncharacterized protein LOC134535639 n=1 Tax=Bacillus rossius redtenbacheri TaxID=93214 RepID=UPI002FDDE03D